jgi:multidrug efflux pump subunit AcrA (membrane-fusion protein)
MAANTTVTPQAQPQQHARTATLTEVIEQLARFDGPPELFLAAMLQVQCKIAPADGGAILRNGGENKFDVLGVYPPVAAGATAPVWLARAVEVSIAITGKDTVIKPMPEAGGIYEATPSKHLILMPLRSGGITGFAAFLVNTNNQAVIARAKERLELTTSLLNLYEMRQTLARRNVDLERLRESMEILASLNEHGRMKAAAMALCNEVASRWQGERVSLGFLKGRYVKLQAMSHTEKFTRKMKLVQDIESAMEECLDQDIEVIHPPAADVAYVCRAAHDLSNRHGPTTVLSVPLRREGKVVAVLTVERAIDTPFSIEEVETLRLMCDLCTARLAELFEHDRWIGAKAMAATRKGAAWVVGSEHTWVKLIALGVMVFLAVAVFVQGPDRVDATFVIEATEKQIVTAPFAGYLIEVGNDEQAVNKDDRKNALAPGSRVVKGQVLARLDTSELTLQIAAAKAEQASYSKEADEALRDGKTSTQQIAQAKAAKVQAQIALLEYQKSQATIVAKIDGILTKGDLKQQIGVPVEPKTMLFEIAPLEEIRADLAVPEDRIADVHVNATGELATASEAGTYFKFTVNRINPVAEVVDQKNIFKARATVTMDDQLKSLIDRGAIKPGIKGVAKIEVGRRSYGYLWTRDLVNWVRMKMWW